MLSIEIEPYAQCHADLEPMLRQLYAETLGPVTGRELKYNRGERLRRDADGRFVMAVARNAAGVAVGFCSFSLNTHWTDGRRVAAEDTLYLMPGWRLGWVHRRLWKAAEDECIRRGAEEIQFIAPASLASRLAIWLRMGFTQTGVQLTKRVAKC